MQNRNSLDQYIVVEPLGVPQMYCEDIRKYHELKSAGEGDIYTQLDKKLYSITVYLTVCLTVLASI